MRVLTMSELLHMTRKELCDLATDIIAAMPNPSAKRAGMTGSAPTHFVDQQSARKHAAASKPIRIM